MVLIESSDTEYKQTLPKFNLKSTKNINLSSDELFKQNGLIIIFTCNHCPYAKAIWNRLIRDYSKIKELGFGLVAINPNIHPDYPKDSFENMIKLSEELNLPFEYLLDETQNTARSYKATCTPDIFIIDKNYKLLYRGAYDDNWKDEELVKEEYLLNYLTKYMKDNQTIPNNKRSIGCSIKWQNEN